MENYLRYDQYNGAAIRAFKGYGEDFNHPFFKKQPENYGWGVTIKYPKYIQQVLDIIESIRSTDDTRRDEDDAWGAACDRIAFHVKGLHKPPKKRKSLPRAKAKRRKR